MNTALFSVAPFPGLVELGRRLARLGWKIIATDAAAQALRDGGVCVIDVATFNDVDEPFPFPPTLHPRMEAALTSTGTDGIDLVFDIPYGLEHGNDVGGLTLLALAAKGKRLPVLTVDDLCAVIDALERTGSAPTELRQALIRKVHLAIVSHYAELVRRDGNEHLLLSASHIADLANGENPYQIPAWIGATGSEDPLALPAFVQLAGERPCYTNLADLDVVLGAMARLHQSFLTNFGKAPLIAVAAKHGNPCGIGIDWGDPGLAVKKALWGHPAAIWGGEMVCNFPIDRDLADLLFSDPKRESVCGDAHWMLHVVAAPDWSSDAVAKLAGNAVRKLLKNPSLASPALCTDQQVRPIRGGILVQPPASYVLDLREAAWDGPLPDFEIKADLIVAWACAYSAMAGGNEVALARGGQLLGLGGGPSTLDAARHCIDQARRNGHVLTGASFAADAFFPVDDAPSMLATEELSAGVVPAGGRRFGEVRSLFSARGISIGYLPADKRGFSRH